MIRHIVSWKLKAEDAAGKDAAFAAMAEAFGPLPHAIESLKALHLGRDLGETSGNWDVVLITDHATAADLADYQNHPAHQPVKAVVGSLYAERSAVDFEL
jgi:hypothetical protein